MNMREGLRILIFMVLTAGILLCERLALSPAAAERQAEERSETMSALLPGGETFLQEEVGSEAELVSAAYKSENGYVVETVVPGYGGELTLWVGVEHDGRVTGLTVRNLSETAGLGRRVLWDGAFLGQFLGTAGDASIGTEIHAISGATVTSKAIAKGVQAAVGYVTGADVSSGATEWGGGS